MEQQSRMGQVIQEVASGRRESTAGASRCCAEKEHIPDGLPSLSPPKGPALGAESPTGPSWQGWKDGIEEPREIICFCCGRARSGTHYATKATFQGGSPEGSQGGGGPKQQLSPLATSSGKVVLPLGPEPLCNGSMFPLSLALSLPSFFPWESGPSSALFPEGTLPKGWKVFTLNNLTPHLPSPVGQIPTQGPLPFSACPTSLPQTKSP